MGGLYSDLGEYKKQDTMLNANTLSKSNVNMLLTMPTTCHMPTSKKNNITFPAIG